MPSDSPCTTYLGSFAARQGHSYLIRNASLARLATLNRKLDELFRAWNVLVFGEEKTGNASEGLPSSPSDCLSNAKMLICLLTFPPCMETQEFEDGGNGQEISYGRLKKRSIQQTEEVPLCR
ncbi:unnamed protein product [Dibothriocephalus latus]|uniref:Uncharacterized protein n=1 Tax=Dibothriocephalus latus TaxID=60516 RepID=A0A3P7NXV4_DIBLA|nr:unnamed protein product [Dibothriocephalus latus]